MQRLQKLFILCFIMRNLYSECSRFYSLITLRRRCCTIQSRTKQDNSEIKWARELLSFLYCWPFPVCFCIDNKKTLTSWALVGDLSGIGPLLLSLCVFLPVPRQRGARDVLIIESFTALFSEISWYSVP